MQTRHPTPLLEWRSPSFHRLVVMSAKLSTSFVRRCVVGIMKRTAVNQISQIVELTTFSALPQSPVALYFLSLAQIYFRHDKWTSRKTIRVRIRSNRVESTKFSTHPQSPVALYFLSLAQIEFRHDGSTSRETISVDPVNSKRHWFYLDFGLKLESFGNSSMRQFWGNLPANSAFDPVPTTAKFHKCLSNKIRNK